jgi:hypothetical protein
VDQRAQGSVGSYEKKSPVTSSGIDPETVRLVARCLNYYATPGPTVGIYREFNILTQSLNTNMIGDRLDRYI